VEVNYRWEIQMAQLDHAVATAAAPSLQLTMPLSADWIAKAQSC
jgi:hypothetical protein